MAYGSDGFDINALPETVEVIVERSIDVKFNAQHQVVFFIDRIDGGEEIEIRMTREDAIGLMARLASAIKHTGE